MTLDFSIRFKENYAVSRWGRIEGLVEFGGGRLLKAMKRTQIAKMLADMLKDTLLLKIIKFMTYRGNNL